ncbi:hypothetical protein EDB85DRAFT_1898384, partial [Lactarius pseudohatsudake]
MAYSTMGAQPGSHPQTRSRWALPRLRQVGVHGTDVSDASFAVDCLTTPTALATALHAVSVVVAELRAEDVLREFSQGRFAPGVASMERWFLDNAVNDIDRETRDRRSTNAILYWEEPGDLGERERHSYYESLDALWNTSSVMTRMVSTRVNPFAGEVQLTYSRIVPAPIYLSKEFDFPYSTNFRQSSSATFPTETLLVYLDLKLLTTLGFPSKSATGTRMKRLPRLSFENNNYNSGPKIAEDIHEVIICNSPTDILRTQVQQFGQSTTSGDENGRYRSSTSFMCSLQPVTSEGIGLVAKDVTASQDALFDNFERIESFFRWLEEYSEVPTTEATRDIVMKNNGR